MRNSVFETALGAVVILVAGVFLFFAMSATDQSGGGSDYELLGRFNDVTGIESGSDVLLAGVKIGRVVDVDMDPQTYEALVTMSVRNDVELPDDSDARIISGLLGGSHIAVQAGGGFDMIPTDGSGEILYTRGSVDIITLFASFASGQGNGGDSN
ncbi:MlaD family protein [Ponticaulis sp.]|uniref:MlaD family protein n=1 Tax=Ponticaulis sp. TaxID=2020902 RepID=UPI0025D0494C|nr:MlaD family protein [Ponticaulis sp.]|tara:strand:+ start:3878 stop:4342 length:465 start_codon:yes stop_codon:yes gene_type:complete